MPVNQSDYRIRTLQRADFAAIQMVCREAYPHDEPYSDRELSEHLARFPEGQFVAEHVPTGTAVGAHFTLRLLMTDYHEDDSWDILTDRGLFDNDNPRGHTLYGADVFVSPNHQHHGLAHILTDAARATVVELCLWRLVGGSRLPGYGKVAATMSAQTYVAEVVAGKRIDPVLTCHLKDGWAVVKPVQGYMQHDPESANWAALMQWINPNSPPPSEFALC